MTEVTKKMLKEKRLLDIDNIKNIDNKIRRINNLALYNGFCSCCGYSDKDQLEMYVHINTEKHYEKLAKKIKSEEK